MHTGFLRAATALSTAVIQTSSAGCQASNKPIAESPDSDIGYDSVAAALKGLRAKSGVAFTTEKGWTIATDESAYTIWSFAPADHPAYPAVVKRQVTPEGNGSRIEMKVLCEASKSACDDLVRTFSAMNGFSLPGQ